MKKIVSILFVALIALAFMGCPTTYPDYEYGISKPTVIASSWGAYALDFKGGNEASVTITEDKDGPWTGSQFGIVYGTVDSPSWSTKYTGATLTEKDTYVDCVLNAANNNGFEGEVTLPITITVKVIGDKVSVKYK